MTTGVRLVQGAASMLGVRSGTEESHYVVAGHIGGLQIRRYGPRIAAQTTVFTDNEATARHLGFRRLAGYIFGGSHSRSKIAMTAPVTGQPTDAPAGQKLAMTAPVSQSTAPHGGWVIRFFMPCSQMVDTLPARNDPAVKLVSAPAETVAVLRFSGDRGSAAVTAHTSDLLAALHDGAYRNRPARRMTATHDAVHGAIGHPGSRRPRIPGDGSRWVETMTSLRGPGSPGESGLCMGDNRRYAMWDAAYVLGSLSGADRREFEVHMADCPSCRTAVAELSGMPALLSQLGRNEVAAITQADQTSGSQKVSPELLPALLNTVSRRRRRARLTTWACGAAAAVVLAVGVFVGIVGHSPVSPPPGASVSALPMAQVGTTVLASTVSLSKQQWGTYIVLKFVCMAPVYAHHDTVAMVVLGRDGSQTRLASWVAIPGDTAMPAGSVALPVNQIAAVQVVLADNGQVMLERSI